MKSKIQAQIDAVKVEQSAKRKAAKILSDTLYNNRVQPTFNKALSAEISSTYVGKFRIGETSTQESREGTRNLHRTQKKIRVQHSKQAVESKFLKEAEIARKKEYYADLNSAKYAMRKKNKAGSDFHN